MRSILRNYGVSSLVAALAVALAGCGGSPTTKTGQTEQEKDADKRLAKKEEKEKVEDDTTPDGWWCKPHGIPEEECSMCQADVRKECKANNDWCEDHNRAKSQCFICEPSLKEKYAARYREKYKMEPPPVTK